MRVWPFLIAASRERDYEWIVLPEIVPVGQRRLASGQLPLVEAISEIRFNVIKFDKGTPIRNALKAFFSDGSESFVQAAWRTYFTLEEGGIPIRDECGRPLMHAYGMLCERNRKIASSMANHCIGKICVLLKTDLQQFLVDRNHILIRSSHINSDLTSNTS